jgi:hypothetical protein
MMNRRFLVHEAVNLVVVSYGMRYNDPNSKRWRGEVENKVKSKLLQFSWPVTLLVYFYIFDH